MISVDPPNSVDLEDIDIDILPVSTLNSHFDGIKVQLKHLMQITFGERIT